MLPDEWVAARTAHLDARLATPVRGFDWVDVAAKIRAAAESFRNTLEEIEARSNFHSYFEREIQTRMEPLEGVLRSAADYERAAQISAKYAATDDPLWRFSWKAIEDTYTREVTAVSAAVARTPYVSDFAIGEVLHKIRAQIPPEIARDTLSPTLIRWLNSKRVRARVLREGLIQGQNPDLAKVLRSLWSALRDSPRTDESYGAERQLALGRATAYFLDEERSAEFDRSVLEAFRQVRREIEAAGFEKVWYGPIFHVSRKEGKLTGDTLEKARSIGYDISSYHGKYSAAHDWVIVRGYADTAANTLAHELGHRYWFKFMSSAQRARFQDEVRTRPTPAANTPEDLEKYLDEMDYLPGEIDSEGRPKTLEPVSHYGGTNVHEAFAEAFEHYVRGHIMTPAQRLSFRRLVGRENF